MNTTTWISKRLRVWTSLGILLLCLILSPAIVNVQADPQRDWTTYLGSNARTNFAANENDINASNVGNLKVDRIYATKGNISSQPLDVQGDLLGSGTVSFGKDGPTPEILWGSWDGKEYATDHNGQLAWSTYLGQSLGCHQKPIGVASTATIITPGQYDRPLEQSPSVAFLGGGDDKLYALDVSSGAILWKTTLGLKPHSFIWSSPAVYMGNVYIGVASTGDCPLAHGSLVKVDVKTGAIQQRFDVVPDGCLGGSIWSSPAIDEATGTVYVTTGNGGKCSSQENYAEAIVALRASNLSLISYWQVPPSQQIKDGDFGATPTLFTANVGGTTHSMIGAVNKNGLYYALDRTALHQGPLWQTRLGTSRNDISSSAWDGVALYVGSQRTTIHGQDCQGSLRALNPATGEFKWQVCFQYGPINTPISAIPGVLFVGVGSQFLAIDASTGAVLFNYKTAAYIDGPATISKGFVFIGDSAGHLYTFKP